MFKKLISVICVSEILNKINLHPENQCSAVVQEQLAKQSAEAGGSNSQSFRGSWQRGQLLCTC